MLSSLKSVRVQFTTLDSSKSKSLWCFSALCDFFRSKVFFRFTKGITIKFHPPPLVSVMDFVSLKRNADFVSFLMPCFFLVFQVIILPSVYSTAAFAVPWVGTFLCTAQAAMNMFLTNLKAAVIMLCAIDRHACMHIQNSDKLSLFQ